MEALLQSTFNQQYTDTTRTCSFIYTFINIIYFYILLYFINTYSIEVPMINVCFLHYFICISTVEYVLNHRNRINFLVTQLNVFWSNFRFIRVSLPFAETISPSISVAITRIGSHFILLFLSVCLGWRRRYPAEVLWSQKAISHFHGCAVIGDLKDVRTREVGKEREDFAACE